MGSGEFDRPLECLWEIDTPYNSICFTCRASVIRELLVSSAKLKESELYSTLVSMGCSDFRAFAALI